VSDLPAPPYPPDTLARGWRFEVDMETFKRSDTWKKARTGALRGALLLLWAEAWQEKPCGTLPDDDELIALMIDMPAASFAKHRDVLRRGWTLASDGRLYHETITARVLAMLEKRAKDAKRAAKNRAKPHEPPPTTPPVTGASRVTDDGLGGEFDTKHQAPSTVYSAPDGAGGEPPPPPKPRRKPATREEAEDARLWREVKALFVEREAAKDTKAAGVLLGALSAKYGADVFKAAARATLAADPAPVEPHTYLVALCETAVGKRPSLNRQEAQEQRNRAVAERWATEGEPHETV